MMPTEGWKRSGKPLGTKGRLCPCVPTTELPLLRTPNMFSSPSLPLTAFYLSHKESSSSTVEARGFH